MLLVPMVTIAENFEQANANAVNEKFIDSLQNLPSSPHQDPSAWLDAYKTLVEKSFIEIFNDTFSDLSKRLHNVNNSLGGDLYNRIQRISEGHNGTKQLAGVMLSMSAFLPRESIQDNAHVEIIKQIFKHHILEIVSDNLEESGLLNEGILNQFRLVLLAKPEEVNVALESAHQAFKDQLSGKKLNAIFKIGNEIQQEQIEMQVQETLGEKFYPNIVPDLLYLNLVAARQASDGLAVYENHPNPVIRNLAIFAKESLLKRYESQIKIRQIQSGETEVKPDTQEMIVTRGEEILTDYTYPATFLAFALSNSEFLKAIERTEFDTLRMAIKDAGIYIRFTNDLGGIMGLDEQEIIKIKDKIKSSIKPNDSIPSYRMGLLKYMLEENSSLTNEDRINLYTLIKDARTNENNMVLDITNAENFNDYVEKVFNKAAAINALGKNKVQALSMQHLRHAIGDHTAYSLWAFMEYCYQLYSRAKDFDTTNTPIVEILKGIINPSSKTTEA